MILPELLGYGGTDKPLKVEAYSLKKMTAELAAILDAEGVDKAFVMGNDHGTAQSVVCALRGC